MDEKELMREKVRMISQKIAARKLQRDDGGATTSQSHNGVGDHPKDGKSRSSAHDEKREDRKGRSSDKRRRKGAKFEGEVRVSHLVKQRKFKSAVPEGQEETEADDQDTVGHI